MTTTEANQAASSEARLLRPEEIGLVVKTHRTMRGWTQETLAELSSGLQTRTIQRVERGEPSSIDTRRAIAGAFQFDDIDVFNSPHFVASDEHLRQKTEALHRGQLLLDARSVDGRQLLNLMQEGASFRTICAKDVADLPRAAQDLFAVIVDFARDCMDLFDATTQTELLGFGDSLNENIEELKATGFCLYAAFRETTLTNNSWVDKTPLRCRITYLLAAPKDQPLTKVLVSRKIAGGF